VTAESLGALAVELPAQVVDRTGLEPVISPFRVVKRRSAAYPCIEGVTMGVGMSTGCVQLLCRLSYARYKSQRRDSNPQPIDSR